MPVASREDVVAELLLRFVIGGVLVSAFAVVGEIFAPKSFSGLFGAAPSVGIATLALTFRTDGRVAVATEARWMLVATVAFVVYSTICVGFCRRRGGPVWLGATAAWIGWFVAAAGLWYGLHDVVGT
jgi:hypothetical protein